MGLKRVDILEQINDWNFYLDRDDYTYQELKKIYYAVKKEKELNIETKEPLIVDLRTKKTKVEEKKQHKTKNQYVREVLLQEIVIFMRQLIGKTRGTEEQIREMFRLHNNFYKRNDSPGCSTCVGTVYKRMLRIYKKYYKRW